MNRTIDSVCESYKKCPLGSKCKRSLTESKVDELIKTGIKMFPVICPIPYKNGCKDYLGE